MSTFSTSIWPLLDPFLVERYRDSACESLALKPIRHRFDIDDWFDCGYLNVALKELRLGNYWPSHQADGTTGH